MRVLTFIFEEFLLIFLKVSRSYIGDFEFYDIFLVLETLSFYDIPFVLETLSFYDISPVLETLSFYDIFPVLETLSLSEKNPGTGALWALKKRCKI